MEITIKTFDELTKEELYRALALRNEVFIVEQECAYQDVDRKDMRAYHVFGKEKNRLVAYARVFKKGDYFENASIGRVLVKKEYRGKALASALMKSAISYITTEMQEDTIALSAQCYLTKFYNDLGFVSKGAEYLEDGIPHIKMVYRTKS
ncbi:GNAT family N-acetyltransferase [Allomuricauda sp. d1]|uniref:GNAT family N-acetyltransferase n=1 Tax=Allomuricauda sp. d1 TaxID=3136725 RepID=UPI0031DDAAD1